MAAFFLACSVVARARAADPGREEHRVDFEAEQVEIAGSQSELSLSGDVVLRAERFQLTADTVTLSRSSRGVHVEGSGRLAFCRCKHPPITLGFSAADLAPPTDVLLEDATVRVFGVPVFYSPYLWLRAPSRPGLFPPSFEYRGEEGVFLGTGVHVPFAREDRQPSALDVGIGAYVSGGTRLSADLRGPGGRARLGWDYFEGSAWAAQANGATTAKSDATWAGSIRMLRGSRAFVAPATVDEVALPTDRARLGVGRAGPLVAFAVTGTSPRGAALDAVPLYGPLLELGGSVSLGARAVGSALLETEALRSDAGAVSASALTTELSGHWPLGPVLSELWLRQRSRAITEEDGDAASFDGEARGRLALPLARRFGVLVHRLEPVVEGAVGIRRSRESVGVRLLEEPDLSERFIVLAGFESAAGWTHEAADVRVMAGVTGEPENETAVVAARVRSSAAAVAVESEARAAPGQRAALVFARADAGISDFLRAALHVEVRRRDPRALARLFHDDFTRPEVPWLAQTGVSAGGSALFPLGFGLRGEVGLEYDVTRERFLGGTSVLGYRHVCDCLGIALWGAKRLGRDAFDLALRVDLVP